MFIPNKYLIIYFSLIQKRSIEPSLHPYKEKHHIVPKSLGGSDAMNNLVSLSPREHFIAHRLLTKITIGPNKQKMQYVIWCMINASNKHQKRITSNTYDKLRTDFSNLRREYKPSLETRKKISNKLKGSKRPWVKQPNLDINGNTKIWAVITPTGEKLEITNLASFCRDHNISQGNLSKYGKSKGYTATFIKKYYD